MSTVTGWRKRTIMEMAREANLPACHTTHPKALERFAALVREDALAQPAPVQEPVGWIDSKGNMICTKINESCKPLYTTLQPATQDNAFEGLAKAVREFATEQRAIEAKLRSKNHD